MLHYVHQPATVCLMFVYNGYLENFPSCILSWTVSRFRFLWSTNWPVQQRFLRPLVKLRKHFFLFVEIELLDILCFFFLWCQQRLWIPLRSAETLRFISFQFYFTLLFISLCLILVHMLVKFEQSYSRFVQPQGLVLELGITVSEV